MDFEDKLSKKVLKRILKIDKELKKYNYNYIGLVKDRKKLIHIFNILTNGRGELYGLGEDDYNYDPPPLPKGRNPGVDRKEGFI